MERIQAAIAKARASREHPGDEAAATSPARRNGTIPNTKVEPPQAERVCTAWDALPELHVPSGRLARGRIIAAEGGREATAFDVIRTRTLQQLQQLQEQERGGKRLAVTSPSAACGKSTVALNLALSLTRHPEVSVALIEMDMRRPSLVKMLRISHRHSVARVLTGESAPEENAVRLGHNLALFTTHSAIRNPSDILHSPTVETALARIEAIYAPTVMIFDMPPMLVSDDTLAFLRYVDAAMLIAAAGSTTIEEIDTCERELAAHSSVMGVVLNKCRYLGKDYGAEYY